MLLEEDLPDALARLDKSMPIPPGDCMVASMAVQTHLAVLESSSRHAFGPFCGFSSQVCMQ